MSKESKETKKLRVTNEFFLKCLDKVEIDREYEQKHGTVGVTFKLNGFPAEVSAWWEGYSKTLEETKADAVYEVLCLLTWVELESLQFIEVKFTIAKDATMTFIQDSMMHNLDIMLHLTNDQGDGEVWLSGDRQILDDLKIKWSPKILSERPSIVIN